jgi:hypothetical protein
MLMSFKIHLSKPRIISKMNKSAFQIPHHVAIRTFVCVQPRRKLSQNIGAGGDSFHTVRKRGETRVDV